MKGEKILVVGPAGNTGLPLCRHLVEGNEVWALARFSSPEVERKLTDISVVTVPRAAQVRELSFSSESIVY